MEIEEAIRKINTYDQAVIIAFHDGSVSDVVEVNTSDAENCAIHLDHISQMYKDSAFQIYDRGYQCEIDRERLEAIIRSLVECIEYSKHRNLKLGANITR